MAGAQASGRILVADDTPEIAEFVRRVLSKKGYEITQANDGEEALRLARALKPDLMILDIMMPKLHGMDVLRQLASHEETASIGVIVCSARNFKGDFDRARELGAFDYLVKPFERQDVLEKVDAFFARRATTAVAPPAMPARAPAPASGAAGEAWSPQLDATGGYWRLWGTRGSIAVPGAKFARHGGNTSCLEVRRGSDLVVIDAGTGIRDLGMELVKEGPREITVLIGHTHWDHIQGFPFFAPAYVKGFKVRLMGASGFGKDLESVFRGQLDRDYFPVELDDMAAELQFGTLSENPLTIGGLKVFWEYTNHPGATVGFRVEVGSVRIAYITDNEFLQGYFGDPRDVKPDSTMLAPFRKIVEFIEGVDVLISEAQYTNDEYVKKVGWGHTSLSNACLLCKLAKVKRWIVTHHDPVHDDDKLQQKLNLTKQILRMIEYPIEVGHAFDGMAEYLPPS